ncbi:MAG: hypothetical protein H6867_03950 [Rhodospirillales bacterium]|nr:hypothetical protein [Rhodospirillales bacterium]MCB9996304.1 hypothetical protein [Rhodospirillales bacterium]
MASFDIAEAAGTGYRQAWAERRYLIRLAMVPFLIKLVCFTAAVQLGWEHNLLRLSIIMMPSYLADGWMLAHLVRLVLLDQRWPFRPTGDTGRDMHVLQDRALGVMRGMVMFAASRFLLGGVTAALSMLSQQGMLEYESQEVSGGTFVATMAMLVFMFWGFRLLWLYIPAAVNYRVIPLLRSIRGFGTSLHLIGAWLLCFVPLFIVLGMVMSVLGASVTEGQASAGTLFIAYTLKLLWDTVIGIVATIAIADGFRQMFSGGSRRSRS